MGAEGALWPARGARGVEDGAVVVGMQFDLRHLADGERAPVVDLADGVFQADHDGVRQIVGITADVDLGERRTVHQMLVDALKPFGIDEGDLGTGIDQAVFRLRPRPPGVERRDDRADQFGGVEAHHPFGQVAHDDGDAVALLDAVGGELRRELERGAGKTLEGRLRRREIRGRRTGARRGRLRGWSAARSSTPWSECRGWFPSRSRSARPGR